MGSRRAQSPDGRKWEVTVSRFRLPSWHHSKYEPEEDRHWSIMAFEYLVLAPLFWFIFPLLRAIVLLPIAAISSVFSSTRWIEAVCRDPGEIKILWRTHKRAASQVADEITRRLSQGYENLTPPEAEYVSMTEPPGLEDHGA